MHVHVDRLLGLVRLDELLLRVREASLVLQVHGVLKVHLRQLLAARGVRQREGVLEGATLGRIVDGLLDETKLGEQLGARLASQRDGPRIRDLLGGVGAAMTLGDADRLVPQVVGAIHVDGGAPVVGLDVVTLGQLEVALGLELLGQVQMRLGEELLAVRRDQPDHVVVPAVLLVHVDRQVGLVNHDVQPFGLLELSRLLEPVRLRDVEHRHLGLRHVLSRHAVRLVPLVGLRVHLDRVGRRAASQVEALGLVVWAFGGGGG